MNRLVRAEIFKVRTTSLWWVFALATLLSTGITLAINCVNAHSLLKPLAQYISLHSHGHGANLPPDFRARLTDEWTLGHSAVTQAAAIFTSGQLIGVLLACLLGIVLVTSEYYNQTASITYLLTPRRTAVVVSKLIAAVALAALSWLVSTVLSIIVGSVFLHAEGFSSQLSSWPVERAMLLNLAAYVLWAVFGIGLGALIRSQLAATVTATVLYLVGAAAAGSIADLVYTYVINHTWVLTAQVIAPAVASAVMVSPTKTFTESPPAWVGAAVLIGYSLVAGAVGVAVLRRRDVT